jgi:hypothetical protein
MTRALGMLTVATAFASALEALAGQATPPPTVDRATLAREVDARLVAHGDGMQVSLWLGGAAGEAVFATQADVARPTASAIKTFYLVELYADHAGRLDAPLDGVEAMLGDDAHPGLSHFTPAQRDEIRAGLRGASVRRIGEVMMGTAPASNIVYNAAANVTTAVLGGPEAITARIRARDAAFAGVAARRYMLRNRTERGDNEAPARALAVLYQRLASRRLAGIDDATMTAIHAALRRDEHPTLGPHFDKTGELDSDPLTRVRAGWFGAPRGPIVYVVMTVQPAPGPTGREASAARLGETARALQDALVDVNPTPP